MGYIEKNLMAGEKIAFEAKLHWIVFFWPVIILIAAIGALVYEYFPVSGILAALAFLWAVPSLIAWSTSEFGVTNKRVIIKVGFIHRHSLEILLAKVEGITVDQEILGRILDYGAIGITGTGGTKEQFDRIANPFEFRKRTQEQIAALQEVK